MNFIRKIKSQDDVIEEFILLGNGIRQITKEIVGEDLKEHERESGKKHPIDIIVTTNNFKVGYEVYYTVPAVSNIIHKINIRRKNGKDVTHWAVLLPYGKALEYASSLGTENIYVIEWDTRNNTRQIDFSFLRAFCPHIS